MINRRQHATMLRVIIGVPIMVCVGTEDVLVRPSNSYMIQRILGARLEEFKGTTRYMHRTWHAHYTMSWPHIGIGHAINGHVHRKFNDLLLEHMRRATSDEVYRSRFYHGHHTRLEYYSHVWRRTRAWAVPLLVYLAVAIRARHVLMTQSRVAPLPSLLAKATNDAISSLTSPSASSLPLSVKVAASLAIAGRSLLWPLLCAYNPSFRHHLISFLTRRL